MSNYKVVPVEPDPIMRVAGSAWTDHPSKCWESMVKAIPRNDMVPVLREDVNTLTSLLAELFLIAYRSGTIDSEEKLCELQSRLNETNK